MTFKLTGHAEIDRQHAVLDGLVGRLERICRLAKEKSDISCRECTTVHRRACTASLASLTDEILSFLVGHVTYEEKLMELLPNVARCRVHIKGHKDAHTDISERLSELAALIGEEHPRAIGTQLHRIASDWIGDHTSLFDASLALDLEGFGGAEIEFDGELVAILDELVFRNRPTGVLPAPSLPLSLASRRPEVQARLAQLTAKQGEVCQLILSGMANKEIAKQLGITINTVKTHRAEIFRKMKVKSLLDLVRTVAIC